MASKSADVRPKITLACSECKERNYITKKNRRNTPDRSRTGESIARAATSRRRTARPADGHRFEPRGTRVPRGFCYACALNHFALCCPHD